MENNQFIKIGKEHFNASHILSFSPTSWSKQDGTTQHAVKITLLSKSMQEYKGKSELKNDVIFALCESAEQANGYGG